jgi:hypothetical protein
VESAVGAEPLRAGTPSKDRSGFGATAASGDAAAAAAASSTAFVICTSIASSVLLIFTNKWVKLCACVNAPNIGLLGGGGGGHQWGSGSNRFSVGSRLDARGGFLALGAPPTPHPRRCEDKRGAMRALCITATEVAKWPRQQLNWTCFGQPHPGPWSPHRYLMQTLQFRYVFALTGLHFLFGGASLKAISVLFGNLPLKEGVPFGPRVVVRDVEDAVPRATLEMGAPPYAGWERRCIVCAHVREDHWLCVSTVAVHGLVGSTHKSAYVASKHGVVGFSKVVSDWARARRPRASHASPTLHLPRFALSVPVRVFVHARCLSSPWRPLARVSPPTAFAQVLCPGAVRWRTLGGPVPSSLPTSLLFFYCVSTTPAG